MQIGPRTAEATRTGNGWTVQQHCRVINGSEYIFLRAVNAQGETTVTGQLRGTSLNAKVIRFGK